MFIQFTSQTKLFVDFSATPLGAGGVGSGGGSIQVMEAENMSVTDEKVVEIIKAIGIKGGAGFRRKTGGLSTVITVNRAKNPSVKWRQVQRDEKVFTVSIQDENNGPRHKLFYATVSKVDRDLDAEGKHQDKVTLMVLFDVEA